MSAEPIKDQRIRVLVDLNTDGSVSVHNYDWVQQWCLLHHKGLDITLTDFSEQAAFPYWKTETLNYSADEPVTVEQPPREPESKGA
jgi:hypothetical protein